MTKKTLISAISLFFALSISCAHRGVRHRASAGQVHDPRVFLSWQRHIPQDKMEFDEANSYCAHLKINSHDDWRLPSRLELISIADYEKVNPSASRYFTSTPIDEYWTQDALPDHPHSYFVVDFSHGHTTSAAADEKHQVRCVRNLFAKEHFDIISARELVFDERLRIVWQKVAPNVELSLAQATAYCGELVLQDFDDWRLPSVYELSFADAALQEKRESPAKRTWSGEPFVLNPYYAWVVDMARKQVFAYHAYLPAKVRCVHDYPQEIEVGNALK